MFLGVIFVEKLPVLFDARGVHDNFCQGCSIFRTICSNAIKRHDFSGTLFAAMLRVV